MNLGKLGVWYFTETMPATKAAEAAQRIEALGYAALWLPETVGRNPFAHAAWLLAKTQKLIVATGIASIYHREPGVTMAAQKTLAEQSNNRFLLGLGVSHKPMVEGVRGLDVRPAGRDDARLPREDGRIAVQRGAAVRSAAACDRGARPEDAGTRARYVHRRASVFQLA